MATKTRTRKYPKRIICEGEEKNKFISVIKEQSTNEKPSLMPQSEHKMTTESAEIATTVLPKSDLR